MTTYKYAATNERFHSLLHFALTFVLVPDLGSVDMPSMTLQLDMLEKDGSCGDQDGTLQVDAYPVGPSRQAELFIVTSRENLSEVSRAGLYTPKEFYQGILDELMYQVKQHPEWKDGAEKLIRRFDLRRFQEI